MEKRAEWMKKKHTQQIQQPHQMYTIKWSVVFLYAIA